MYNLYIGVWSISRKSKGFRDDSDGEESTHNAGNQASIPGLGRIPGGGHGNSL